MPLLNRRQLPRVGEVVIGTVKELHDYGAYLIIEDYNGLRAFLPWSEVSSKFYRYIDDVVKTNERVAVKVIRVDVAKGQIDVSLKRVTEDERRSKMTWWKRTQKAVNIVLLTAKELKKSEREAYEEVIWRLEDMFGDVMSGLEAAALEGEEPLVKAGVPAEWVPKLVEAARKYVELKRFKASVVATIRSVASDGVERVKSVLNAMLSSLSGFKDLSAKAYVIGSPRYRFDLVSLDYKVLEDALKILEEAGKAQAAKVGAEFSLERLKE